MRFSHLLAIPILGFSMVAEAQYGCGTPYTSPCQVQIQRQNSPQEIYNMINSFDPGKALNDGWNASQRYDLQEQELQLRKQEIELRRMEIERRKRQLQQ